MWPFSTICCLLCLSPLTHTYPPMLFIFDLLNTLKIISLMELLWPYFLQQRELDVHFSVLSTYTSPHIHHIHSQSLLLRCIKNACFHPGRFELLTAYLVCHLMCGTYRYGFIRENLAKIALTYHFWVPNS